MSRLKDDGELVELIDELKQAEYNRGLQDAWELAKGLYLGKNQKYSDNQYEKIFGGLGLCYVFDNCTAQEALAKIEAYEKEQAEIKVGDVVEYCERKVAILITKISNDEFSGIKITTDEFGVAGDIYSGRKLKDCTKTGKHIDIASILAEIGKE